MRRSRFAVVVAGGLSVAIAAVPTAAWSVDTVPFAPSVDYPVGNHPGGIVAGDFNGDGNIDLATANSGDGTVSILIGAGDGTFATAVDYPAKGPTGLGGTLATGDLNNDGDLDLVVGNETDDSVSILLGHGNGTFGASVEVGVVGGPSAVRTSDLDGDGNLDVVTASAGTPDGVGVLLGHGDGTFASVVIYATDADPFRVSVADVDGDGAQDLVTTNHSDSTVSVLIGNGDGTFAAHVDHPVAFNPYALAAGDLNGDSDVDLVLAPVTAGHAYVELGNGDGTFGAATEYDVSDHTRNVAIGDLNGDGHADVAVTDTSTAGLRVLLGQGDGTLMAANVAGVGAGPWDVALADFDADGNLDAATANVVDDNVSVLLNRPDITKPTVTINQAAGQADPTSDESVRFAVAFSEPITGFANSDVTLSGSAGATTAVVAPDPSGTADRDFVVTVSGFAGPGEVTATISAGAVTDLASNGNEASTSTDNTVLFQPQFTKGPSPSITGTPRVGATLTAKTGSPVPTPDSYLYRWFADGKQIPGATGKTFKVTTSQLHKRITLRVYAKKAGYVTISALSAQTSSISGLQAKALLLKPDEDTVWRRQRVDVEIERLASGEPWTLYFDKTKVGSGHASSKGRVKTAYTVPSTARSGKHVLKVTGRFPDRVDTDTLKVK